MKLVFLVLHVSGKTEDARVTTDTLEIARMFMVKDRRSVPVSPRKISSPRGSDGEPIRFNFAESGNAQLKMPSSVESQLANALETIAALQSRIDSLEKSLAASEKRHAFELQQQREEFDRVKNLEISQLRMRLTTELSETFSQKVQLLSSEHSASVAKLMKALQEKQKTEHQLTAMIQKQKAKIRALSAKAHMKNLPEESWDVDEIADQKPEGRDVSIQCISTVEEKPYRPGLVVDTAKREVLAEGVFRCVASSENGELKSPRAIEEALSPSANPIVAALRKSFPALTTMWKVVRLSKRGKVRNRNIWLEECENVFPDDEEAFDRSKLKQVTVAWSTSSVLKGRYDTRFALTEVQTVSSGQRCPLFSKSPQLREKEDLSMWVKYRGTHYLALIFPDRLSKVQWICSLVLGVMLLTHRRPDPAHWEPIIRELESCYPSEEVSA